MAALNTPIHLQFIDVRASHSTGTLDRLVRHIALLPKRTRRHQLRMGVATLERRHQRQ